MQAAQRVTKSAFAGMMGVHPSRVSQFISEKKIFGAALVGEGRNARIDVEVACRQLGVTLDPVQLAAQSRPPLPLVADAGEEPSSGAAGGGSEMQRRRLQAMTEKAEIEARSARRREESDRGVYVLTADARREWAKQLAELMAGLEDLVPGFAEALAAEMKIDAKEATVILRREFRAWRTRWSQAAATEAAAEPAFVEEPTEDA